MNITYLGAMAAAFGGAFGFHSRTNNDQPGGPITTLPRRCPKRGLARGGLTSEDYVQRRDGWRRKTAKAPRHVFGTPWPTPKAKLNDEAANTNIRQTDFRNTPDGSR